MYDHINICKIRETSESGGVQSAMMQHDGMGDVSGFENRKDPTTYKSVLPLSKGNQILFLTGPYAKPFTKGDPINPSPFICRVEIRRGVLFNKCGVECAFVMHLSTSSSFIFPW